MFTDFFGLSWETSTFKNYNSEDSKHSGSKRIEADGELVQKSASGERASRVSSVQRVSSVRESVMYNTARVLGIPQLTKQGTGVSVTRATEKSIEAIWVALSVFRCSFFDSKRESGQKIG